MLLENLRLDPVPLQGLEDDLEDEGVEDEADVDEAGHLSVGIAGAAAARTANAGATSETVLDLRDAGLQQRGAFPARSGSHGTASGAGGGSHRGGYPRRGGAAAASAPSVGSPAWPATTPGPAPCDPPAIDLEQVLQALLLHQGLLEDHEVMSQRELGDSLGATGSRPLTGAVSPSWRTLREMRRHGPLGELSEDAQTALLGGTLYAYGGQGSRAALPRTSEEPGIPLDASGHIVFQGTHAISTRGQRRSRGGGDSLETSFDSLDASYMTRTQTHESAGAGHAETVNFEETAESLSQAGAAPTFASLLQNSLDRILQQVHREQPGASHHGQAPAPHSGPPSLRNDFGLRFGGFSGGGIADRSLMNTARSIRTISSSVLGPRSPSGGSGASVTEDVADASFASRPVAISREASDDELRVRELEAAIMETTPLASAAVSPQAGNHSHHTDEDEGVVSVVGFDSPRSMDSPASPSFSQRPPTLRGQLRERDLLEETGSVWGLGDTVHSSTSTVRSDSAQQSARTIEVGLEGITGMFARLASENLLLDESVTRSVRRVLQLGTVLTGQRLSEDEIRALPQVRFDAAEQQNCAICLEAYKRGEFLTSLRCGHFFHVDCLARWFQRSAQCPLCRSECID